MATTVVEVSLLRNVNSAPKFLGENRRLGHKTTTFEASARHCIMELPLAYNTRSIKAGEELLLYREKKEDENKGPKSIDAKRLLHRALAQDSASSASLVGAAPELQPRKRARRVLPGDPVPPPPPPPAQPPASA